MALTASSAGAARSINSTSGFTVATCSATFEPRGSQATFLPPSAAVTLKRTSCRGWQPVRSCADASARFGTKGQPEHASRAAVFEQHQGPGNDRFFVHVAEQHRDCANPHRRSHAAFRAARGIEPRAEGRSRALDFQADQVPGHPAAVGGHRHHFLAYVATLPERDHAVEPGFDRRRLFVQVEPEASHAQSDAIRLDALSALRHRRKQLLRFRFGKQQLEAERTFEAFCLERSHARKPAQAAQALSVLQLGVFHDQELVEVRLELFQTRRVSRDDDFAGVAPEQGLGDKPAFTAQERAFDGAAQRRSGKIVRLHSLQPDLAFRADDTQRRGRPEILETHRSRRQLARGGSVAGNERRTHRVTQAWGGYAGRRGCFVFGALERDLRAHAVRLRAHWRPRCRKSCSVQQTTTARSLPPNARPRWPHPSTTLATKAATTLSAATATASSAASMKSSVALRIIPASTCSGTPSRSASSRRLKAGASHSRACSTSSAKSGATPPPPAMLTMRPGAARITLPPSGTPSISEA